MKRAIPWIIPLTMLLVWQAGSQFGVLQDQVMPAPTAVAEAGWRLARSGELWRDIAISTWRAFTGFAIGGGIGFFLGMLNGLSTLSERLTDSTLQMVRNIPHLALIPLVILWFGIGEEAKLFLVALGVFFPIYVNTLHGVRSVDRQLLEMARAYGMSERAIFWQRGVPRRAALDLRRPALRPGHHVADLDRGGDDLGVLRHRVHGDECPRVHDGGCRGDLHPDLCRFGQAG